MSWGKQLIDRVVRFLFPPRCVLCEKLLVDGSGDICPECFTAARVFAHQPWNIPHVKSWHALWHYGGTVRDSLVRYKFWHRRSYCVTYGRELAQRIRESKVSYDTISWVPISFLRKVGRGYDQVELVAEVVGRELGQAPVRLLHKYRHNRKQSTVRGIENRRRNVRNVYRIENGAEVKGKRILLLEDIITTGATISEASRVLKENGAKEVHAACIAVANKYF